MGRKASLSLGLTGPESGSYKADDKENDTQHYNADARMIRVVLHLQAINAESPPRLAAEAAAEFE